MYYSDDYIEHHGVLGMKWGVRKDRAVAGVKRYAKNAKAKKAAAKEERLTVKANRLAGKYVNSEIAKGTGAVGGKAVAQGAKSEINRTKKAWNVATEVRYTKSGLGALAGIWMLTSGATTFATPVGAAVIAGASANALVAHYTNKKQQQLLDRAIYTIDDGDIATRVDRGLRDRDY